MIQQTVRRLLRAEFPDEEARYFAPMSIGSTPSTADEGVALILDGIKTGTSSAYWHYPDGRIPFVGALSVLLDGSGRARAVLQTEEVEVKPFGAVNADFAFAYGEGDRTLDWFRSEIGAWYRGEAARHGKSFSDDTPIICERFTILRRL
jgi:uncharacterized protein YhfF